VAAPGSKVVLTEMVRGVNGAVMEEVTSLLDLAMLAATGTPERTLDEYKSLFHSAGYHKAIRHLPLRDVLSVIEVDV